MRSVDQRSRTRIGAKGTLLILIIGPIATLAQDRDIVVLEGDDNSYEVSDQIADPNERKAFLELYGRKDPAAE